ncbi:hypothetical protein [Parasitella parasitica]|uniref:F-box domain-containing protein n=1 Tax=Parasitella parasitica TaxID=35722 RepID=A0A0B7NCY4_9FUNG|nr:hypothetical protein [Parasitella parasitica]
MESLNVKKNGPLNKVPLEIWILIFQNVNHDDKSPNIKALGECRKVCKLWSLILEPVLLKEASLISNANMKKFKDAFKNRTRVACFKQLHVWDSNNLPNGFDLELYNKVMSLAFTPNLTRLEGFFENEDFYKVLIEMIESSDVKFDRLKYVPYPDGFSSLYNRLILNLTDSLENIYVDFTYPCDSSPNVNLIRRFGEFKSLKTTLVSGHLNDSSLTDLNNLLDTQQKVKTLEFDWFEAEEDYSIEQWFEGSDRHEKLSTLDLFKAENFGCYPHCLEYSLKKFEKIKKIDIKMDRLDCDAATYLRKHKVVFGMLRNTQEYRFSFEIHPYYKDCEDKLLVDLGLNKNSIEYHCRYTMITITKTSI